MAFSLLKIETSFPSDFSEMERHEGIVNPQKIMFFYPPFLYILLFVHGMSKALNSVRVRRIPQFGKPYHTSIDDRL